MPSPIFVACIASLAGNALAFFPSAPKINAFGSVNKVAQQQSSALYSDNPDRNFFGSKLMPDPTDMEMEEMFKEFNITTSFDINKDPDLMKWYPSKEFFEKFGFQNMTEKYQRKTMDVKVDFYAAYRKPILPQYKTFIADIMAMTFVQTIDARYKYDALHAFGICTQYYTIMKGYALQDEIDEIFNQMMKAVGFDPQVIRDDAKRMLSLIKEGNPSADDILNAKDGELAQILIDVRENRFFKYTDAWGVGLGRMMELVGSEPNPESFEKWSTSLRWVFTPRLISTWDEFSGDQLRMQGIEAMQKQLMIREKKRSASRLEKKASEFEDKKKALQVLNEDIEERRQQLIDDQMALKKKYEPDAYEAILLKDKNDLAAK